MRRLIAILALSFLIAPCPRGSAAERAKPGPAAASSTLRMEDLEVRGLREKPETLYVPALRGVARPSPVRYDLFLEDMNRAVSPREIAPQTPPPAATR
jgi:hypothetical protein